MATWSLHLSYSKHNFNLWKSSSFRTENISRRSNMEIPHSVSLLDGLELCTSHVRSISTKPLTRAAELCDAVPKGACFSKKFANVAKFAKYCQISKISAWKSGRFWKMLQNAYFLAKIGADTAENEQHSAEILPTDALWRHQAPLWGTLGTASTSRRAAGQVERSC